MDLIRLLWRDGKSLLRRSADIDGELCDVEGPVQGRYLCVCLDSVPARLVDRVRMVFACLDRLRLEMLEYLGHKRVVV